MTFSAGFLLSILLLPVTQLMVQGKGPFVNENKLHVQTLSTLAEFSVELQPHLAFMTVKSLNAITNLNFKLDKINGLAFDLKKTATSIPGCQALPCCRWLTNSLLTLSL